jgi:hypothetical protein
MVDGVEGAAHHPEAARLGTGTVLRSRSLLPLVATHERGV